MSLAYGTEICFCRLRIRDTESIFIFLSDVPGSRAVV